MTEILQGDVKVPGIGKTKKKYIFIPAGIAAAYVAWKWFQASREEEPAPGADGFYNSDLSEMGLSTGGGAYNPGGNSGSDETDGTRPDAIDTNAEWTQRATEILSNAGYDPAVVLAALGEFLGRRALDKAEASIARAAVAAVGQPPEGRPWTVIEEAGTGTGTLAAPTGLRVGTVTHFSAGLVWSGVAGAGSYKVYRNGSAIGTATGTSFTVAGLAQNNSYSFNVSAVGTTGKEGPKSATVTAKTDPAPVANRPPTATKPPTASKPKYRTMRISRRDQSLSGLVADYNRKYKTSHTWQQIWDYNLRNRSSATAQTLRARGPHKVFIGSSFWFPI